MLTDQNFSSILEEIEPPTGLFERVIKRLLVEKELARMRLKFWLGVVFFIVAFLLVVATVQSFLSEIIRSGFIDYTSLVWSNFRSFTTDWQDFSLSLLESFPVVNALELLLVIIPLIFSARAIVVYRKSRLFVSI